MLFLPMEAFAIVCMGEYIELTIDEVWGYPDQTSYPGGYAAKGRLSICADGFTINEAEHYFETGELYAFMRQLEMCHASLTGEAILENTENTLRMICQFDKLGHVTVVGEFRKHTDGRDNCLIFDIRTDQTQIARVLISLKKVSKVFGGQRGIKD